MTSWLLALRCCAFPPQEIIEVYYKVFGGLDVKIIYYIRRQEELIQSAFLEWVKSDWDYSKSIKNHFKNHRKSYDFSIRIKPWEDLFGASRIESHLYDQRLCEDVCIHFLGCIRMEGIVRDTELFRSNKSLLPDFFELVHKLDQMNMATEDRAEIVEILLKLSDKLENKEKTNLIDDQLMNEINMVYRDSNFQFAEKYLTKVESEYFLKPDPINA